MQVCDRCRKEFGREEALQPVLISKKKFDLCPKCATKTINYIQESGVKKGMLGGVKQLLE